MVTECRAFSARGVRGVWPRPRGTSSCGFSKTRPRSHLFVAESVGGTIEPAHVHALRLAACRAPGGDDSVAGLQSRFGEPDVGELPPVVQFEVPLLRGAATTNIDEDERMWLHEAELRDDP